MAVGFLDCHGEERSAETIQLDRYVAALLAMTSRFGLSR